MLAYVSLKDIARQMYRYMSVLGIDMGGRGVHVVARSSMPRTYSAQPQLHGESVHVLHLLPPTAALQLLRRMTGTSILCFRHYELLQNAPGIIFIT